MQKFATPLLLAYNSENEDTIKTITQDLSAVLDFKYAGIKRDQEESLTALAQGYEGPILLFISDNFLRSTKCMQDGLAMLNAHNNQILPIVTPGFRLQEDGTHEEIVASFERVSDIIQYINFWQDRYLDLRRQKREDATLSTPGFEAHLKTVRSISGEAGEYLRLLRGMEYLSIEAFTADRYRSLFQFLDAEALIEQLPEPLVALPPNTGTDEPEAAQQPEELLHDEDEPPIDLGSIPGMQMIDQAPPPVGESINEPIETHLTTAENEPTPPEDQVLDNAEQEPDDQEEKQGEQETETVAEQDPVALLLDKSWRLADSGDLPTATTLLSAGLDQFPQSDLLQYNYALLLAQQDQNEEAKTIVDELLTRNPQHEAGLYLAAELADIDGQPTRAQKYLVRLVRLHDQDADVWYKLGLLSLQEDPPKYEQAERYLKQATKRAHCPAGAYYELGLLYSNHFDKPKKALKYFETTLQLEPDHPFVNYDIALLLYHKGKKKRAYDAYQKAILLNPEIQTPENDAAFTSSTQHADLEQEQNTLQVLKDNIAQLEALLQQREEDMAEAASKDLKPGAGKTVLITGATSGIGLATAEKYAENGFRLIITGRRKKRLAQLQTRWAESYGTESYTLHFDIRNPDATQAAIAGLPDEWFDIDILINNAGKAKGLAPIYEGQLEHWEEMIDTNLKGLLYITRAITPRMVARGSGHVINVASTAGKEVYPNGNVYCATKHAVDALTRAMRLDLHQHGIRVSQVAPAHVEETEFALVRFDGDVDKAKIYTDFKPLRSRDVAETIYFMSQQPAHVNILDIVLQGTQQANSTTIDRSGRERYEEEE